MSSSFFGFSNGRTKWMTVTVGWSLSDDDEETILKRLMNY